MGAEQTIAERLRILVSAGPAWPPIDAARAIPWVERRGLQLAASQREAVRIALSSKVLVITGGPGVSKTTLVNSILKILIAKQVHVALCAPTGRAAKRLSESTGLEAKTIHRPLESDFYFIDAAQPEEGIDKVIALVRDRIPKAFGLDPIRDAQVLCLMNRGGLGARAR